MTHDDVCGCPMCTAASVPAIERFLKYDRGKPLYTLLPPNAVAAVARVLTYGAAKYGPNNFKNATIEDVDRYLSACYRHVEASRMGETHDPESGEHHWAHAIANLLLILELETM